MTELTDEDFAKLADDCTLAAKCMEDTDTFPTGQAILREAARALLDARAENARLRADAQAAVVLVIEQAAKVPRLHAKQLQQNGLTAMSSDFDHIEAAIRALAPADGLAAVEALRAEARESAMQALASMGQAQEAYEAQLKAEAERDRIAAALAAAKQRESRRTFPVLKGDGAKIDYQLVADHSEQARRNHYQSVDRLAARGGLSWCELYAVLHNLEWEKVDTNEAMIACRSLEARYLAALAEVQARDKKEMGG